MRCVRTLVLRDGLTTIYFWLEATQAELLKQLFADGGCINDKYGIILTKLCFFFVISGWWAASSGFLG